VDPAARVHHPNRHPWTKTVREGVCSRTYLLPPHPTQILNTPSWRRSPPSWHKWYVLSICWWDIPRQGVVEPGEWEPRLRVNLPTLDISIKTDIPRTACSYFTTLLPIRSIQRSVNRSLLLSLVISLILSRFHYNSIILTGIRGQGQFVKESVVALTSYHHPLGINYCQVDARLFRLLALWARIMLTGRCTGTSFNCLLSGSCDRFSIFSRCCIRLEGWLSLMVISLTLWQSLLSSIYRFCWYY